MPAVLARLLAGGIIQPLSSRWYPHEWPTAIPANFGLRLINRLDLTFGVTLAQTRPCYVPRRSYAKPRSDKHTRQNKRNDTREMARPSRGPRKPSAGNLPRLNWADATLPAGKEEAG